MDEVVATGGKYPRQIRSRLEKALNNSRVVWLGGPRQAGKTTLVKSIAQNQMLYVSLDEERWSEWAQSNPGEFLRRFDRVVIDEVQIAPKLLKAIKIEVDNDSRWGRCLLTGSANILNVPRVSESLA